MEEVNIGEIGADNAEGDTDFPDSYAVSDPSQVKSVAPVTYSETGDIIAPSRRFAPSKDSILYSQSQKTESRFIRYLQ